MNYRGAVIGCGYFARNHFNAWAETPRAKIEAVCDLRADKARATAAQFGIPRWYADPVTMLAAERLDFIDIVTTPETHRALVELAAPHARLIICQKPIAENIIDARAMVAAVEQHGGRLMVHENFRWQRPFREIRALVAAGVIGQPHFARFSFRHGFTDYHLNQPYLLTAERFALLDLGVHLFDLTRCFLGDTRTIACRTQRLNPIVRGEDTFTVMLGHVSGATSILDCSFHTRLVPHRCPQTTAWIEGEAGTIELGEDYKLTLHHAGRREERFVEAPVPSWGEKPWHVVQESVTAFNRHVVEVLDGTAEPQPSGTDSLVTLALTLAAYEAAATDSVVTHFADPERTATSTGAGARVA